MTDGNPLHIKLSYKESFQAKKSILSSQINLLKMAKAIENYQQLRYDELELKSGLFKDMKELKMSFGKLQNTLPKLKIPEILKKTPGRYREEERKPVKTRKSGGEIEEQLLEIERKLNELQGRNV